MQLIHQHDERGYFTGVTVERDIALYGVPYRYTAAPLPALAAGQFARLNGDAWEVTDEDPDAQRIEAEKEKACADYLATVRSLREQILNRLAGIAAAAIVSGDEATQDAFVQVRQRLLDITTIPAALAAYAVNDPIALEAAVKKEYAAIVASAPLSITTAFKENDK